MRFLRSKLSWSLFLLGIVGFAVYGGDVLATPPSGLNNVLLARGTDQSEGSLPIEEGTDIVVAQITVIPGGSSGWHTHPGGAIVVISKGNLTVYKSRGSKCEVFTYAAGQAFIERPGEIDDVVNTGSIPYVLLVTFPRVPVGGPARIDVPDPGTCLGL
jgi:quercetin dioxygenase-like cupin family protein